MAATFFDGRRADFGSGPVRHDKPDPLLGKPFAAEMRPTGRFLAVPTCAVLPICLERSQQIQYPFDRRSGLGGTANPIAATPAKTAMKIQSHHAKTCVAAAVLMVFYSERTQAGEDPQQGGGEYGEEYAEDLAEEVREEPAGDEVLSEVESEVEIEIEEMPIADEAIKRLVSRAAGMPRDTFREILNTGGRTDEIAGRVVSTPLSVWLMDALVEDRSSEDFKLLGPIEPTALAKTLERGSRANVRSTYASFIRPQYVVDFDRYFEDGAIVGRIQYLVPEMYQGWVDFVIVEHDDQWVVTELILPVSERLFALDEEGRWQTELP